MKIIENKSLKELNTFGVTAIAKYYYEVINIEDMLELSQSDIFNKERKMLLGGGSNVLFTSDFDGLIIKISGTEFRIIENSDDYVIVEADAGTQWDGFVRYCIENDLYGLENLAAIPGSVGAAPMQNIGAYGIEQEKYFHSLTLFDFTDNSEKTYLKEDCDFGYRTSVFKSMEQGTFGIMSVRYKFPKIWSPVLTYKDLSNYFDTAPTAWDIYKAVTEIRNQKLPDYKQLGNSGSFFKNPVVDSDLVKKLLSTYPEMPNFVVTDDERKIPAGWLIEQAGLKGFRRADAGIYDKHALIIVNHGTATGRDIYELAEYVRTSVKDKFGIELEYEVNIVK